MVRKGLMKSLKDLQLNYLDLYLIHLPIGLREGGDDLMPRSPDGELITSDVDYLESWKGMEKVYDEGLCKSIGISNFSSEQIQRILESCKVKPVNHQIEVHPYLTNAKIIHFCE